MRWYDDADAVLSEFISEGAEMLAHPPDRPAQFAREFDKTVDLFKPTPKPCPFTPDWRRLAREDFYLRCGVLLLTMAYNGKDGREYVIPMAVSADSLLGFSSRHGSDSRLSKEISNASQSDPAL